MSDPNSDFNIRKYLTETEQFAPGFEPAPANKDRHTRNNNIEPQECIYCGGTGKEGGKRRRDNRGYPNCKVCGGKGELIEGTGLSQAEEIAQDMIDGGMAATSDQNFNDLYAQYMKRYDNWGYPNQLREDVREAYKAILKSQWEGTPSHEHGRPVNEDPDERTPKAKKAAAYKAGWADSKANNGFNMSHLPTTWGPTGGEYQRGYKDHQDSMKTNETAPQGEAPGAQVKGKRKAKKAGPNGEHPFSGELVGESDDSWYDWAQEKGDIHPDVDKFLQDEPMGSYNDDEPLSHSDGMYAEGEEDEKERIFRQVMGWKDDNSYYDDDDPRQIDYDHQTPHVDEGEWVDGDYIDDDGENLGGDFEEYGDEEYGMGGDLEEQLLGEYEDWDDDEDDDYGEEEDASVTITGKLPENSYWNHRGKHQDKVEQLEQLVPASEEVEDYENNPALEKFRQMANIYYDVYNNGGWNTGNGQRGDEFHELFDLGPGHRIDTDDLEELVDETVEAAWAEQEAAMERGVEQGYADSSAGKGEFEEGLQTSVNFGSQRRTQHSRSLNPSSDYDDDDGDEWVVDPERLAAFQDKYPVKEDDDDLIGKGDMDMGDELTVDTGDLVQVDSKLGGEATVVAQRAGYIVVNLPKGGMKLLRDDEWWIDDSDEFGSDGYTDVEYDDSEPEELAFEDGSSGPESAVGKSVQTHIGGVMYAGIIDKVFQMGPTKNGPWYGKASFMNDRHSGKGFNVKLDPSTFEPITEDQAAVMGQHSQDDRQNSFFSKMREGYRIMPPMDPKYVERDGLEGPFTTHSGKVVYYDPKAGKYYDPDTDMYMSSDEYAAYDKDPNMEYPEFKAPEPRPAPARVRGRMDEEDDDYDDDLDIDSIQFLTPGDEGKLVPDGKKMKFKRERGERDFKKSIDEAPGFVKKAGKWVKRGFQGFDNDFSNPTDMVKRHQNYDTDSLKGLKDPKGNKVGHKMHRFQQDLINRNLRKRGERDFEKYMDESTIDTERYPRRDDDGLSGPYQTASGSVYYMNRKTGEYYDPDSDINMDYTDFKLGNEGINEGGSGTEFGPQYNPNMKYTDRRAPDPGDTVMTKHGKGVVVDSDQNNEGYYVFFQVELIDGEYDGVVKQYHITAVKKLEEGMNEADKKTKNRGIEIPGKFRSRYDQIPIDADPKTYGLETDVSPSDRMKRKMDQELGHEDKLNNYAIIIDGKHWKTVKNEMHADSIVRTLRKKGKDAEWRFGPFPLSESKWNYKDSMKNKGPGYSADGDGGAKNRKNRKAFRKAEKKKKHQAMMRGEKWAQEKEPANMDEAIVPYDGEDGYNWLDDESGEVTRDHPDTISARDKEARDKTRAELEDEFGKDLSGMWYDPADHEDVDQVNPLSAEAFSQFGDIAGGGGDPIDHLITDMGYSMEDIDAEAVSQGYADAHEWAGSFSDLVGEGASDFKKGYKNKGGGYGKPTKAHQKKAGSKFNRKAAKKDLSEIETATDQLDQDRGLGDPLASPEADISGDAELAGMQQLIKNMVQEPDQDMSDAIQDIANPMDQGMDQGMDQELQTDELAQLRSILGLLK